MNETLRPKKVSLQIRQLFPDFWRRARVKVLRSLKFDLGGTGLTRRWNTPWRKPTYLKSKEAWNVFWQRADLKWHRYDPAPQVGSLEKFLALIDEDKHACFFG